MLTLGIDSSTRTLSVALVENQKVRAESSFGAEQQHAELLPELISNLYTEANLSIFDVSAVAVGVGPGAFTGLRVGLMFAKSFGFARSIQVFGVCTHDIIAPTNFTGAVVTDARRKEVYFSNYLNGKRLESPIVIKPDLAATLADTFVGDAIDVYPDKFLNGKTITVSAGRLGMLVNHAVMAGEKVAQLVPNEFAAASDGKGALPKEVGILLPPLPIYLRRPDVVEPTKL